MKNIDWPLVIGGLIGFTFATLLFILIFGIRTGLILTGISLAAMIL